MFIFQVLYAAFFFLLVRKNDANKIGKQCVPNATKNVWSISEILKIRIIKPFKCLALNLWLHNCILIWFQLLINKEKWYPIRLKYPANDIPSNWNANDYTVFILFSFLLQNKNFITYFLWLIYIHIYIKDIFPLCSIKYNWKRKKILIL